MTDTGVDIDGDPLGRYCHGAKKYMAGDGQEPRKLTSYLENPDDEDRIMFDIEGNEYELMYVT